MENLKESVRKLRHAIPTETGEILSQTEFGRMIGKSLNTIQRYEGLVPPKGAVLMQLHQLAAKHEQIELAQVFWEAAAEDLGIGDEGFAKLQNAWRHAFPVTVALSDIRSRTKDQAILKAAKSIETGVEAMMDAIESVLPMKSVQREGQDGSVQTGKRIDAEAIRKRAGRKLKAE